MNIYELFGGLICPIIIVIFLVLSEIFKKNKIIDFIMTILFMGSCLFCVYFNTQIKVNYFNVFVYGSALLGYWYFSIMVYIKRNIDKAKKEIKDKIDSCEMSIRLDIANLPKRFITEKIIFGEVHNAIEDASKKKR